MKLKGLKNLQPVLLKAGGAIAGNFVTKLIPFGSNDPAKAVSSDRVKQAVVAAVGIIGSGSKGAIGQICEGMAIGGIANLAKAFGIGADGFIMGTDGFIGDVYEDTTVSGTGPDSGFADGNY